MLHGITHPAAADYAVRPIARCVASLAAVIQRHCSVRHPVSSVHIVLHAVHQRNNRQVAVLGLSDIASNDIAGDARGGEQRGKVGIDYRAAGVDT